MPTRKIRPAAQTQANVVANTTATPRIGSHHGMPGGIDCRAIISIGVDGGKYDMLTARPPSGSRMMLVSTNIGKQITNITGMSSDCDSLASVDAAPTAIKTEPNISTAKVW